MPAGSYVVVWDFGDHLFKLLCVCKIGETVKEALKSLDTRLNNKTWESRKNIEKLSI